MRAIIIVIFLAMSAPAQNGSESLVHQLDQITEEYNAIRIHGDIGKLVALDNRLRTLIHEPWKRKKRSFDGKLWKPNWKDIGVWVSHYGYDLFYSGRLLVEAHRIDPDSAYRQSTLFSTILGERNSAGLGEMPDTQAALQYLHEFPNGPFADESSIILANFYNDLFKVLRNLQSNEPKDYKYKCFEKYIQTKDTAAQTDEAKRLSIFYYSRALDLRSSSKSEWAETKDAKKWMLEMEHENPRGWHFCAD